MATKCSHNSSPQVVCLIHVNDNSKPEPPLISCFVDHVRFKGLFSLFLSSCARLWFKGWCEGSLEDSVVATSLIHVEKKTERSTLHVLLPEESPEISKFTRGQREKTETTARSIIHTHTEVRKKGKILTG